MTRRVLLVVLLAGVVTVLAWLLFVPPKLQAASGHASITDLRAAVTEQQIAVKGELSVALTPELSDAAARGVPLYFTRETRLLQKRHWWFDRTVSKKLETWRIQYNALLRRWVLIKSDDYEYTYSMSEALRKITGDVYWSMPLTESLQPGSQYSVEAIFKLDTSRLPGPFQIFTFRSNSNWSLSSQWKNLDLSVSEN